jgi:GNAT superfamily N-acetyltransferase
MSLAVEEAFKVEIPHHVGERLNTVGETAEHLLTLISARKQISTIRIEAATTPQQWAEMEEIRNQVFSLENRFSFQPLPGPGAAGIWHFVARDNHEAIGTLSVVDTTGDRQIHQRYRLSFTENVRVARYAQLAILKPYRKRGIFKTLIEIAQSTVVAPKGFAVEWLLYPAAHVRSSMLTQGLGFTAETPLLTTEFGRCHVLMRRVPNLAQVRRIDESLPNIETCPI